MAKCVSLAWKLETDGIRCLFVCRACQVDFNLLSVPVYLLFDFPLVIRRSVTNVIRGVQGTTQTNVHMQVVC